MWDDLGGEEEEKCRAANQLMEAEKGVVCVCGFQGGVETGSGGSKGTVVLYEQIWI